LGKIILGKFYEGKYNGNAGKDFPGLKFDGGFQVQEVKSLDFPYVSNYKNNWH
jgi:hypothetical protein